MGGTLSFRGFLGVAGRDGRWEIGWCGSGNAVRECMVLFGNAVSDEAKVGLLLSKVEEKGRGLFRSVLVMVMLADIVHESAL